MDEEILSPKAGLARRAEHLGRQLREGDVAPAALLLFAGNLEGPATRATGATPLPFRAAEARLLQGSFRGTPVTVACSGIGAPAAAVLAEKLIAAGASRLVGVGYAGGLHDLERGTVIAVEGALREEGVSAHYGHTGPEVPADRDLSKALGKTADVAGKIVTTDAPYRETRRKVAAWKAAGALAVEMETAGLLAVAPFRGARAGAVVVVTDRLGETGWVPAEAGTVDGAVERALAAALAALLP